METNQIKPRRSILDELKLISTNKRRSIFENSAEQEKNASYLEEWDKIWGKYNTDYVNVFQYPKHYMEDIKNDYKARIEGCTVLAEKVDMEFIEEVIVDDCELAMEKKAVLQDINSRIGKLVEKCENSLKRLELYVDLHETKLKNIEQELKIKKAILLSKMKIKQ